MKCKEQQRRKRSIFGVGDNSVSVGSTVGHPTKPSSKTPPQPSKQTHRLTAQVGLHGFDALLVEDAHGLAGNVADVRGE